jgi:hypothetical protein
LGDVLRWGDGVVDRGTGHWGGCYTENERNEEGD